MINLVAPINELSYGYVSSEILYYLSKKTNVTLFPIGQPNVDVKYIQAYNQATKNQEIWKTAPSLRIYHEFDLALHAGKPTIAFPFFEIDTLDGRRINHLSYQDHVFVATKWAKEVLSKYNIDSTVIPLGVGSEFVPVENKANKCIFATIGKWEHRKGHDILHKIFNKAFPTEQDVELWCFTSNPFLTQEEKEKWEGQYRVELDSRVKFIPRLPQIRDLLSFVHCGVFLSRAEGWNLGCLEMMAMGKHIIATNYSGHTEYCTNDNCNLVNIDEFEPAYDGKWFFNTGNWAKLNNNVVDQTVSYMRQIYGKFYQNEKNNIAGIETGKKFTFERTADEIITNIDRISQNG